MSGDQLGDFVHWYKFQSLLETLKLGQVEESDSSVDNLPFFISNPFLQFFVSPFHVSRLLCHLFYCTRTSFPIFCYSSCVLHSSCFTNSPINVFCKHFLFFSGLRNRQVGSHLMNDHSSRSHSMLTVYIDIESVSTTPSSTYVNRSVRTWVFFDLENKVWQTRGRCLGSGKVIIACVIIVGLANVYMKI